MEKREGISYLSAFGRICRRLRTAPALLAYLIALLLVSASAIGERLLGKEGFLNPPGPLLSLLFHYWLFPLLTFLFALYYYRQPSRFKKGVAAIPVHNPRWEALLVTGLYCLWLIFLVSKLLTDRYLLPLNHILANFLEGTPLVSLWTVGYLQVFAEVLLFKLVPAFIIFRVLFRYPWRELGIKWHWGWTVAGGLATLFAAFLLGPQEPKRSLAFLLGNYFLQLGTVAFPEEFFYRGLLQTRLERISTDPLNGLVAATLLFGLAHFPHLLIEGYTVPQALAKSLFYQGNAGLFLGVLYYKGRNLGLLIFLHALFNSWG